MSEAEFLRHLAENNWLEYVEGRLRPTMSAASINHAFIIANTYDLLKSWADRLKHGRVFGDGLHFNLYPEAGGLRGTRIPDVSFVRLARLQALTNLEGLFPGPPDLAVEVVSPRESEAETLAKIKDYLEAGSNEAWVLYPREKSLHRYLHPASPPEIYAPETVLAPESLFPACQTQVKVFFEFNLD
jgi:Uma2 family endonuclease